MVLGLFHRGFESVKKAFLSGFSKIYLFVSTILCLDTWILYTRSENADKNRKRKNFLLFLLVLLPLLLLGGESFFDISFSILHPKKLELKSFRKIFSHFILSLAGTYIYLDPPQKLSFPKITLPKLRLPKITLPSLPTLSFPKFSLPSFPTISWPNFSFTLPSFSFSWPVVSFEFLKFSRPEWFKFPAWEWPEISLSLPDWSFSWVALPAWSFSFPDWSFSWPEISFAWLQFSRPEWLRLPTWEWPDLSLPSISWPTISLPSLPKFSFPSMPSFSFDISSYTGYIADKFEALRFFAFEIFGKIRETTVDLLNEAQIVWNENFNTVSNAK